MSAELTPAVVVGSVRYGETSRVVRLATREGGVRAAIAKGALRPKSRFGASLQLLSEGTAHLLPSRGDLQTLTAFDLATPHAGLATDLERFRTAVALAELVGRFVPAGPNHELYDAFVGHLALLEAAPQDTVPVLGLRALWEVIGALGHAPEVARCARCGGDLPSGAAGFSYREGGFLCAECARGGTATVLAAPDREALEELLAARGDLPYLPPRHLAAHRRLLARWVHAHLGDVPLPALTAWQGGGAAPDDGAARRD